MARHRANIIEELGETTEDMEAMQTMLSACASYCTKLESRIEEMTEPPSAPEAFNANHVRRAIQEAVQATMEMPRPERKKEIHKLLLRWHPGMILPLHKCPPS